MARFTIETLQQMKAQHEKIAVLTAYDASFAALLDENGVDAFIVGDSLGMVIQGKASTREVTVDDMVYHSANVARGSQQTFIITDMPYLSYSSPKQAEENARRLVNEGGAQMVKIEGGRQQLAVIEALVLAGIPVCGHLGLEPQSVTEPEGYRVQGRDEDSAARIIEDARLLEQAGVQVLVLECIPSALGKRITDALAIPVIGIGAGVDCDGQVLVTYDMLGISRGHKAKFVHNFLAGQPDIDAAIQAFVGAVKSGHYPGPEHSYQ